MKLAVAACVVVGLASPVEARFPCLGEPEWAPGPGAVLPRHPHLMLAAPRSVEHMLGHLVATIDGKAVKVVVTPSAYAPNARFDVDIASDRTGELVLAIANDYQGAKPAPATFQIVADAKLPAHVAVYFGRYLHTSDPSNPKAEYRGIAVHLKDDRGVIAHMRLRADRNAAWKAIDIPIALEDGSPTIRIGKIGCWWTYPWPELDRGLDIDGTIVLADGRERRIEGMPMHYVPLPATP